MSYRGNSIIYKSKYVSCGDKCFKENFAIILKTMQYSEIKRKLF